MINFRISELETTIKGAFDNIKDVKISSIDTLYEKDKNDNYKLVITIHNINFEEITIIHTKIIFKTNSDKTELIENSFAYLYDLNCKFELVEFTNLDDLKNKIKDIFINNKFSKDIVKISNFIQTPGMLINYYFNKNKIIKYSVTDFTYNPKFKSFPCEETQFDFVIILNNDYSINVSLNKENDKFILNSNYLDKDKKIEVDGVTDLHFTVGKLLYDILEEE